MKTNESFVNIDKGEQGGTYEICCCINDFRSSFIVLQDLPMKFFLNIYQNQSFFITLKFKSLIVVIVEHID